MPLGVQRDGVRDKELLRTWEILILWVWQTRLPRMDYSSGWGSRRCP